MQKKIFYLIDDDPFFHYMVKRSLNNLPEKLDLKIFKHGLEALRNLKALNKATHFPDIIFLDIHMPVLNGWEFLEEYEKLENTSTKSTYIYMVSGSEDLQTIHKAMDLKILAGYFTKPISQAELSMILEEKPRDYWDTFRKMKSFENLQSHRNNSLKIFKKFRI